MKQIIALLFALWSLGSVGQVKIGLVDTQQLLDTMPSLKAAEKKIEDREKELIEDLKNLQTEIQKLEKDYQEKMNDLTPILRQASEKKLQDKYAHFQTSQQAAQEELQAYGEELNAPILERLKQAVKTVSEQQKLTMVVDKNTTLYSSDTMEITKIVAVELLKLEEQLNTSNN